MSAAPPVLLLDLGGVLIDVVSARRLAEIAGAEEADMAARWARSRFLAAYERGECGAAAFARGAVDELRLPLSPGAFLDEFALFLKGYSEGAEALLRRLHARHPLACLTDTNAAQWASLCGRLHIDTYFRHCFLSFQIGAQKPDPMVYRHVIRALGRDPADILYFDDREANVRAGLDAGMRAHAVSGVDALRERLAALGLL